MSNVTAEQAAAELRLAYMRRNESDVTKLGNRLTTLVARLLADQKPEPLDRLIHALGPLIQAADARGTEKPGNQWRRLSQLATMLRDHPQELEVRRWLHRDSVNGQLLRLIRDEPGITVKVLAERADHRKVNQVSNALGRLEEAGYITRVSDGRFAHLYLTPLAERKLKAYYGEQLALVEEYVATGSVETPSKEPVFSSPQREAAHAQKVQWNPSPGWMDQWAGKHVQLKEPAHAIVIIDEAMAILGDVGIAAGALTGAPMGVVSAATGGLGASGPYYRLGPHKAKVSIKAEIPEMPVKVSRGIKIRLHDADRWPDMDSDLSQNLIREGHEPNVIEAGLFHDSGVIAEVKKHYAGTALRPAGKINTKRKRYPQQR